MILSDSEIQLAKKRGDIVIEPFDRFALGGNSYDVHLGPKLLTYVRLQQVDERGFYIRGTEEPMDCKKELQTDEHTIGPEGFVLHPGVLYLASTVEYTETRRYVPYLDGKSSIGRLGISIHATAGRGDVGFCNHWTMELAVVHPVRVYAGMPIGQLTYHEVAGEVLRKYDVKVGAKYNGRDPNPQPSRMFRNFPKE